MASYIRRRKFLATLGVAVSAWPLAARARSVLSIEDQPARIPGGLEPEDWALLMRVLDTIKGAIPPGSISPPAEILEVIETALRAHFAREIPA